MLSLHRRRSPHIYIRRDSFPFSGTVLRNIFAALAYQPALQEIIVLGYFYPRRWITALGDYLWSYRFTICVNVHHRQKPPHSQGLCVDQLYYILLRLYLSRSSILLQQHHFMIDACPRGFYPDKVNARAYTSAIRISTVPNNTVLTHDLVSINQILDPLTFDVVNRHLDPIMPRH